MPEAFKITAVGNRATVRLRSWTVTRASSELPLLVPPSLGGEVRLFNLSPGEWWIVSDTLNGTQLASSLRRHAEGCDIAVVDLSSALNTLRVEGPAAREVLAKGCGLDLHPRHFLAGQATRTRFAQLSVLIHCADPGPRFELYVGRSYVAWLKSWLEDAAVEFRRSQPNERKALSLSR